jgi:type I site-specific restriction endonuclease
MNEAETRAEHIDPALKAAGWGVVEGSRVLREHGITTGRLQGAGQRARAEIADYVLTPVPIWAICRPATEPGKTICIRRLA